MANKNNSGIQNGGFIKLNRNLMSQPEIAKLIDKEGPAGLALYISINLYLAHCEGGWGLYTGRQFSILAMEVKKKRSDVRRVIDNYNLFIIDGNRFTSPWMMEQFAHAGQKSHSSRANLIIRAEEIDIEKKIIEKDSVRVSDDTHLTTSDEHPLTPSSESEDVSSNYKDYNHYLNR